MFGGREMLSWFDGPCSRSRHNSSPFHGGGASNLTDSLPGPSFIEVLRNEKAVFRYTQNFCGRGDVHAGRTDICRSGRGRRQTAYRRAENNTRPQSARLWRPSGRCREGEGDRLAEIPRPATEPIVDRRYGRGGKGQGPRCL